MLINPRIVRADRAPPASASLWLDFERDVARVAGRQVRIADIVAVTRATPGAGYAADGPLVDYAANELRYWRAGGRRGILIERGATNYAKFSSNPTGTGWTTAHGATVYFNNAAGIGGAFTASNCVDTAAAGTAAGTWAHTEAIPTAAQWWTVSAYVKQTSGARLRLYIGITNGGATIGGYAIFDTSVGVVVAADPGIYARVDQAPFGFVRISVSIYNTINTGAAALVGSLTRESNSASPIVFDLDRFQINPGKSATSPLFTTDTTATRLADVVSVDLSSLPGVYNSTLGAIYVDATLTGDESQAQTLVNLAGPAGTGNIINLQRYVSTAGSINALVMAGGSVAYTGSASGATSLPRRVRAALRFCPSLCRMAVAGTVADWTDAPFGFGAIDLTGSGAIPSNIATLQIGHTDGASLLDGVVHRIGIFPNYLQNAELSALVQ